MESGEISSEQITASSQYNSNWSPERSRLNYQENGWTPSDDTIREWIQVSDFSGGWRTNWSYVTLVLVWQSDLRSVGRRKARSPRFEPCRTSEISLASGLNIVHSFVPLLHWKKTGNNPTCIIYWDLPLQRGWHIFLSSLWNLTYGSLRSLNVERLQQHNYFKKYAAGQEVETGRLVHRVRASCNKLFPVQAAFTSGAFHSVNSETFFFLFCWMYSGRKQVPWHTGTERSKHFSFYYMKNTTIFSVEMHVEFVHSF